MEEVFLLLGSNLGDREQLLEDATKKMQSRCGKLMQYSSIYESEPWGFDDNHNFLNQVVVIHTELSPHKLLKEILAIEEELGRVRKNQQMASRVIDIDILFYGEQILEDTALHIPHPKIQDRRFTLIPLLELAPQKSHPVLKKTISRLYHDCSDNLKVMSYFDRSLFSNYEME
ncbi:MAG: 2-amino-4-hydroxy-6-hydroxymethyldihydropteridine diphosphokinase [Bacteroidales bacterium]|nr:2-amino-4-hydroxy-6-hydroxymethyldihydropteridine diphosphokinase [Bacteroidales bacterium]MCF8333595.1 2-amino-4-hydroxy-6-hydroxymethyldihydropteridine diphosphokinase [Bacteroidales bacterium]